VGSEPWHLPDRRREIDIRLGAVRARIKELKNRDLNAEMDRAATSGERLEAAQRHAAEAHAAVAQVLASSAAAFRHAAEAHERAARMHDWTAAAGIGDVIGHERQAARHRAAAAADWRRAGRARLLFSDHERVGPAAVCGEPHDGVAL
jgi:hypothetical protein